MVTNMIVMATEI